MWTDAANVGNAYTYVGNNPVNRLDPMGLVPPLGGLHFGPLDPFGVLGDMPDDQPNLLNRGLLSRHLAPLLNAQLGRRVDGYNWDPSDAAVAQCDADCEDNGWKIFYDGPPDCSGPWYDWGAAIGCVVEMAEAAAEAVGMCKQRCRSCLDLQIPEPVGSPGGSSGFNPNGLLPGLIQGAPEYAQPQKVWGWGKVWADSPDPNKVWGWGKVWADSPDPNKVWGWGKVWADSPDPNKVWGWGKVWQEPPE